MNLTSADIARFWSKVNKDGPVVRAELGPCWLWTGGTYDGRYGALSIGAHGKISAHRASFAISSGPIPEEMLVCHSCDTTLCVRPDHLFLGTPLSNMADKCQKGRQSKGVAHGNSIRPNAARGERHARKTKPECTARGQGHGRARITEEIVREMRALHAGGMTAKDAGARFGLSPCQSWEICTRRAWVHVA